MALLSRVATLTAVLFVIGGASAQASETLQKIVASYLQIQTQLASDSMDGVKDSAAAIAEQGAGMGEPGAAIVRAAKAVEAAGELKEAREAFGTLSDAVIAAAKADKWQGLGEVKVAFCPMANKSWLQKGDTIRNPYYGSQMLTCGSFTER